jgi:hypothetical protein
MDRKRFRFIEGDIDLTFLFTLRTTGVTCIITDNTTECDVALADLEHAALIFYRSKIHELSGAKHIERIRTLLGKAI